MVGYDFGFASCSRVAWCVVLCCSVGEVLRCAHGSVGEITCVCFSVGNENQSVAAREYGMLEQVPYLDENKW